MATTIEDIKIEYKGKKYGVWFCNKEIQFIRSESNPNKTPYLKVASKRFKEICEFISK